MLIVCGLVESPCKMREKTEDNEKVEDDEKAEDGR
jgi:hypothetical protein